MKKYFILKALIHFIGLVSGSCVTVSAQQIVDRPNVIYILADDLGYGDLSFLGQKHFKTPHIDRLARQGMVFTQHYSGSSVCAPSRSALMTGQHTGHTPVRGNKEILPEGQYPLPDEALTIAEVLKDEGYTTGAFGKWGLGYPGSEGDPNRQGFDEFYGYNCQRLAHNYYPRHLWHNQEKVMLAGNTGLASGQYAPELIHRQALAFMESNKDHPFFLYYASPLPHAELLVPSANLSAFSGKLLPEKSYHGLDSGEGFRQGPYGSQRESHAAFAAMVTLLDQQVGELMAKLDELGISEQTLLIFSSDNGPHAEGGADPKYFNSNGSFRGIKRDLYEGGIHVPMIARWPGKVNAGTTSGHISAFWDVLPTVATITGAPVPDNLDGISFLPTLLQEGRQRTHPFLYWEFHENGGRIAVRQGKWKALKYNVLTAPDSPVELYDLDADPGETTDVAAVHPDKVAALTEIMETARTESEVFRFGGTAYVGEK